MQAAKLPAMAGWLWIREGFALFRKQPMAIFFWAMLITLAVGLAVETAPVGALIFICLMPVITVLTLSACRNISRDRPMLPSMWFKPLSSPGVMASLLRMGLLYGGVSLLAGLVAFLPFRDAIGRAMDETVATQDLAPMFDALGPALIIMAVLYIVIAALFWYAPILVTWHRLKLVQALFFSGVAFWRNKWAFLLYGACLAGISIGVDIVAGSLIWLGLTPDIVHVLQVPVNIAVGGIVYCSFYPAYVSVFGLDQADDKSIESNPTAAVD